METEGYYGSRIYGMYLYVKNCKDGNDENSAVKSDMSIYTLAVNIKKEFFRIK
jgi:hypothetical protein